MINNFKTPSRVAEIFVVFLIAILSGLILTEVRSTASAEEIENEQNVNTANVVPGGEFTLYRQADNTVDAPDRILFETGEAYLERGQYARARLALQTLLSTYPDSDLASEAYLAMGETYYEEEVSPGVWETLIKYDRPATENVD